MKKIFRISLTVFTVISSLIINSCKKGSDGAPGKDGSSNVTSHTYSVPSWNSDANKWYTNLSVPELTTDNINTASVQVYFGKTANSWTAIPLTYVGTTDYFMGYIATTNSVQVTWDYNGVGIGSDPNSIYGITCTYKVVVIPPAARLANPNVNFKNYNEVKEVFNLKD